MLEEYLLDCGYNKNQIKLFMNHFLLHQKAEDTILFSFKNLYKYLYKNGFSREDIVYITTKNPNLVNTSLENIRNKLSDLEQLGFKKNLVFQLLKGYPYLIDISTKTIEKRISQLLNIGFTYQDISKEAKLLSYDDNSFQKCFDKLIKVGYSIEQAILLITNDFSIIEEKEKLFSQKYHELKKIGMSKGLFLSLTSKFPNLLRDDDLFYNKFSFFLEKSFSPTDCLSILKKLPILIDSDYEGIMNSSFDTFEKFQFREEEYKELVMKNPYIILYPSSQIEDKFSFFKKYNFSIEDRKKLFIYQPIILGFTKDNLKNKLDFYKKKRLTNLIVTDSDSLLFSVNYLQARYNFLKANYYSFEDIVLSEKKFNKKYKSTWDILKEDLDEFIN